MFQQAFDPDKELSYYFFFSRGRVVVSNMFNTKMKGFYHAILYLSILATLYQDSVCVRECIPAAARVTGRPPSPPPQNSHTLNAKHACVPYIIYTPSIHAGGRERSQRDECKHPSRSACASECTHTHIHTPRLWETMSYGHYGCIIPPMHRSLPPAQTAVAATSFKYENMVNVCQTAAKLRESIGAFFDTHRACPFAWHRRTPTTTYLPSRRPPLEPPEPDA